MPKNKKYRTYLHLGFSFRTLIVLFGGNERRKKMSTTCQINFENNPQKIVFSGQKLHITVRIKLTEEIKIRRIYIQLRGMAHVSFVIDDCMCVSSYGQSGRYATDESVLDVRKCLVDGNGNANKSVAVILQTEHVIS